MDKFWIITRYDHKVIYDSNYGHVIKASTENAARSLAAQDACDEGRDIWFSDDVVCKELKVEDYPEGSCIVLSDTLTG